jgi:hypothetical protein
MLTVTAISGHLVDTVPMPTLCDFFSDVCKGKQNTERFSHSVYISMLKGSHGDFHAPLGIDFP